MGPMISLINLAFSAYYVLLVARAILPWLPHDRAQSLIKAVYQLTDPVLDPIRIALPPLKIGYDVSPFLALIFCWLLQRLMILLLGV